MGLTWFKAQFEVKTNSSFDSEASGYYRTFEDELSSRRDNSEGRRMATSENTKYSNETKKNGGIDEIAAEIFEEIAYKSVTKTSEG